MWPLWFLVVLCCLSRSAAISGPRKVGGYIGESLTIICNYDAGYETLRKQWCRGFPWIFCKMLVETNGTEKMLTKDRVTIRDNQSQRSFTVTMENLRLYDAGTYFCGIEKYKHHLVHVQVIRDSALTTRTTTTTKMALTTVPPEETTHSPSVTNLPSNTNTTSPVPLLLPIIPAMLLLLLLVAILLPWRKLKRHRIASRVSPNPDAQEEDDNEEEEEVCYAHLTLHRCAPESIYANRTPHKSLSTTRSPEMTMEYSSIRRTKTGL